MNNTNDLQEKTDIKQILDNKTGEVAEAIGTKVYKLESRVEFLQLYTANLKILYTLEGQDSKVLLFIFQSLSFMNTVSLNPSFKKNIKEGLGIAQPTVSRSLSRLISKGILIPITSFPELREKYEAYTNDIYFLDPNIVGKGPFRELEKLRYTMVKEYNLDEMTVTNTVNIEHAYAGFDDVSKNIDKHEVIDVKTAQINDKTKETDILIAEKNERINNTEPISVQQPLEVEVAKIVPPKESLFDTQVETPSDKDKSEADKALEIEIKKIEVLKLEVENTNLYIIKKLIDAGKFDEALEFKRILRDEKLGDKK